MSTDLLEREILALAQAMRDVAGNARKPIEPGEDPAARLEGLAQRLERAADDLDLVRVVTLPARQREQTAPIARRNDR
jgi:hypothetical protein